MRNIYRDALEVIGLRRRSGAWLPRTLGAFGAGLMVGAISALALAPKAGRDLRSDVVDSAQKLINRSRDQLRIKLNQVKDQAASTTKDVGF